ncbi:hypothetical protein KKG52_02015 [Patescibacteria group bacterium]|nr:hypothetical protein [Patescibacteria group bacterium]
MESFLFQTSLLAAFVAGIVALFAPCCITFLLPAYFGSVFKEKEKVLLMTLVFGLGIFATLFPAVVGISLISKSLFTFHDSIYYLGGTVLIIVSAVTLFGFKLPMPRFPSQKEQKLDYGSVFTMGVFSGITSACCAPVLIGILTFAFLSPSFLGASLIGIFYVLGMVTPLLIISLFLDGKVDKISNFKKPITFVKIFGKERAIFTSNAIASLIFFTSGVFILIFNYKGKLSMGKSEGFARMIQDSATYVSNFSGNNFLLNIVVPFVILLTLIVLSLRAFKD